MTQGAELIERRYVKFVEGEFIWWTLMHYEQYKQVA